MSQFSLAPETEDGTDMVASVQDAFRNRLHLVDRAPGFIDMRIVSPRERPRDFWLLTFWTDEASYHRWHRSHAYHDSHKGLPKGLKLVRGSTKVTFLDLIAS